MNKQDHKLMINICYQCLRSSLLTAEQIADIDKLLPKLYDKAFTNGDRTWSGMKSKNGQKKKAIRLTGKKSKDQKNHMTIHGSK